MQIDLSLEEIDALIHAAHNARWMTEHESEMIAIDRHIWMLPPERRHALGVALLDKLLPAKQ